MDSFKKKILMYFVGGCIGLIMMGVFALICSFFPAIAELLFYAVIIWCLILYYLAFVKPNL